MVFGMGGKKILKKGKSWKNWQIGPGKRGRVPGPSTLGHTRKGSGRWFLHMEDARTGPLL